MPYIVNEKFYASIGAEYVLFAAFFVSLIYQKKHFCMPWVKFLRDNSRRD